jgi:hypothetical protein
MAYRQCCAHAYRQAEQSVALRLGPFPGDHHGWMGPVTFRPRPPGEGPGQNSSLARWKNPGRFAPVVASQIPRLIIEEQSMIKPSAPSGPISRPASALGRLGGLILGEISTSRAAGRRAPAAATYQRRRRLAG